MFEIKVAPYSLVQFINDLYRSVRSDVILTTFVWNFCGSLFYVPKHGNPSLFLKFSES